VRGTLIAVTSIVAGVVLGAVVLPQLDGPAPDSADGGRYYCAQHYCPEPASPTSGDGLPAGPSCVYRPANPLHPKSPPPCTNYFNPAGMPISEAVPPGYRVLRPGPPWPMVVADRR
jgi:hypothetical protein